MSTVFETATTLEQKRGEMIYLYQLQFDVGSPFYIGISKNLQKRKLSHIYGAKNGRMSKDKFIRRHIGLQSLCIEPLGIFENIEEAERAESLLIECIR